MDPLTIAGLIFTGATVASLIKLHTTSVRVPRLGQWRNPPNIYVESPGPVSMQEVEEAAAWWRAQGFKLGEVRRADAVGTTVPPTVAAGAIVVGALDPRYITTTAQGHAQWFVEYPLQSDEFGKDDQYVSRVTDVVGPVDDGYIRHARIGIEAGLTAVSKSRALRHELGHAMGFAHCETTLLRLWKRKNGGKAQIVGRKKGHIMHPEAQHVGTDIDGMQP